MTSKMCDCNQGRLPCSCKVEVEHGLGVSATKVRIDDQAKQIPPAVAQFMAGERQQLQATIAEQAREIEHWKGWAQANWNEFAGVTKTQPSGVVPAWIIDALKALNGLNYTEADYAEREGVDCVFCRAEKFNAAFEPLGKVITELARLNSSPVSADLIRFDFINADGQPDSKMITHDEMRERYSAACVPAVSAGGVTERAAFEADELRRHPGAPLFRMPESHNRAGQYQNQYVESAWRAWQARAALSASAPNHSEQVREGWQLVPVEPTPEMLSAPDSVIQRYGAKLVYQRMLAAAPSAGSQEQE